jgi:hypothetical protein
MFVVVVVVVMASPRLGRGVYSLFSMAMTLCARRRLLAQFSFSREAFRTTEGDVYPCEKEWIRS